MLSIISVYEYEYINLSKKKSDNPSLSEDLFFSDKIELSD